MSIASSPTEVVAKRLVACVRALADLRRALLTKCGGRRQLIRGERRAERFQRGAEAPRCAIGEPRRAHGT